MWYFARESAPGEFWQVLEQPTELSLTVVIVGSEEAYAADASARRGGVSRALVIAYAIPAGRLAGTAVAIWKLCHVLTDPSQQAVS